MAWRTRQQSMRDAHLRALRFLRDDIREHVKTEPDHAIPHHRADEFLRELLEEVLHEGAAPEPVRFGTITSVSISADTIRATQIPPAQVDYSSGPWSDFKQGLRYDEPAVEVREAIVAAALQVAEDAQAEVGMSTDHAEALAYMAVEKAFTSFAEMIGWGPR